MKHQQAQAKSASDFEDFRLAESKVHTSVQQEFVGCDGNGMKWDKGF